MFLLPHWPLRAPTGNVAPGGLCVLPPHRQLSNCQCLSRPSSCVGAWSRWAPKPWGFGQPVKESTRPKEKSKLGPVQKNPSKIVYIMIVVHNINHVRSLLAAPFTTTNHPPTAFFPKKRPRSRALGSPPWSGSFVATSRRRVGSLRIESSCWKRYRGGGRLGGWWVSWGLVKVFLGVRGWVLGEIRCN